MIKKLFNLVFILLLVFIIIFSGIQLYGYLKIDNQIKQDDINMKNFSPYISQDEFDLTKLLEAKKINEDVCGWITIPNTNIDYPILYSEENNYYLYRNLYKEDREYGSIFLDYRCNSNFLDFNSIIYGHHMANGSMFGDLVDYKSSDFFENNNVAFLYTLDKVYRVELFSYYTTKPTSDTYDISFMSPNDKIKYLDYIKSKSIHYKESNIDINKDRIITLSTCSYEFEDARTVLHGKMVEIQQ